jgi:hypothetical protein
MALFGIGGGFSMPGMNLFGGGMSSIFGGGSSLFGSSSGMAGGVGGGLLGGLAGLLMSGGNPLGMLLGGLIGGLLGNLLGNLFNHQPQQPQYAPQYPQPTQYGGSQNGCQANGCPSPYPSQYQQMPIGTGYPPGTQWNPPHQQWGGQNWGGCHQPPPPREGCQPPCQPPANGCQQGGTMTQEGPGKPINFCSPGGYNVKIDGTTVTVTDPTGKNTVTESGDPHEYVNGQHVDDWNGNTRTLLLPDGTRITMNADGSNKPIQSTSIFSGGQEYQINNNNNTITSQTFNPYQSYQDATHQSMGNTAELGFNRGGAFTLMNLFNQSPNMCITPYYQDLATVGGCHNQNYYNNGQWNGQQTVYSAWQQANQGE